MSETFFEMGLFKGLRQSVSPKINDKVGNKSFWDKPAAAQLHSRTGPARRTLLTRPGRVHLTGRNGVTTTMPLRCTKTFKVLVLFGQLH